MTIFRTMAIPTMMLLAIGGMVSVPSAAQPMKTAPRPAKTLDIAGIRPGMEAADAVALLQRTGWTVRANPGDSWAEVVADAVARRRDQMPPNSARSGVYSYSAAKGEESISLNITPTPNGGRASIRSLALAFSTSKRRCRRRRLLQPSRPRRPYWAGTRRLPSRVRSVVAPVRRRWATRLPA